MPTKKLEGEIVAAWEDAGNAWIALAVNEPAPAGRMEYNACVPLTGRTDVNGEALPDLADMNDADRLTVLIEAVKAVRDERIGVNRAIAVASKVVTL